MSLVGDPTLHLRHDTRGHWTDASGLPLPLPSLDGCLDLDLEIGPNSPGLQETPPRSFAAPGARNARPAAATVCPTPYDLSNTSDTHCRSGNGAWAPRPVVARDEAALAKGAASSQGWPSAMATARAAV